MFLILFSISNLMVAFYFTTCTAFKVFSDWVPVVGFSMWGILIIISIIISIKFRSDNKEINRT